MVHADWAMGWRHACLECKLSATPVFVYNLTLLIFFDSGNVEDQSASPAAL